VAYLLLGANFSQVPFEQLQTLDRHAEQLRSVYFSKNSDGMPQPGILISTCNRFEVYLDSQNPEADTKRIWQATAQVTGMTRDQVSTILKVTSGTAVAQHLYQVASGLQSMVVGESEITGQVRSALRFSQSHGQISGLLNVLFQSALATAKKVSARTGLGSAGRSIIATAIGLLGRADSRAKVLVLGTGAYARVVVNTLQKSGYNDITTFSFTGRAAAFAAKHSTIAAPHNDLGLLMQDADLVIAASGRTKHAVGYHLAKQVSQNRVSPLQIVDVALSPSVSPAAYELPNIQVLDLDFISRHVPAEHHEAIHEANGIVAAELERFLTEQQARRLAPAISALKIRVDKWVAAETARVAKESGSEAASEVRRSLVRITNAMLHEPMVQAKALAANDKLQDLDSAIAKIANLEELVGTVHGYQI
jgi:glutamyl-tRNA reductase